MQSVQDLPGFLLKKETLKIAEDIWGAFSSLSWGQGGVLEQIFDMNLCYGGSGTFYGIEKSCRLTKIWLAKVVPSCTILGIWPLGILPKIGFKNTCFFLTPPPVLDLETHFYGYD